MTVLNQYRQERQKFLDECVRCGICADECPILPHTDAGPPREVQEAVFDSVKNGTFSGLAYTKAFACMECFKCTADVCPKHLNPMLINELIKERYIAQGLAPSAFIDSRDADSPQRIIASLFTLEAEYKRITTRTPAQDVAGLFFPGCNLYFQPEKILNALDILDAIGESYAFLPGLDHCCGDNAFFFGRREEGSNAADKLIRAIGRYNPDRLILWCPTCLCRLDACLSPAMDLPFEVISFPQYLSKNMKKLPLKAGPQKTLTLHEACKSAYTGLDLMGPRQVLSQLPGVKLKEMAHHGTDTLCCGSGAAAWFPDACSKVRSARLEEAARTGADQMVTVCHYCNQTFASQSAEFGLDVVNYVDLVARSMGIFREDRFKKYAQCKDLGSIVADLEGRMACLPFETNKMIETLRSVFIR